MVQLKYKYIKPVTKLVVNNKNIIYSKYIKWSHNRHIKTNSQRVV